MSADAMVQQGTSVRAGARPRRVAFLVDRLGSEYTDATLAEVAAAAREHGASVLCCVGGRLLPGDLVQNRHFAYDLANPKTVDAVVVLPLGGHISQDELAAFCRRYEPRPLCSIAVPWVQYPRVLIENDTGLREAIRHLIRAHRHRRVAFVRGPLRNAEAELRYRVYQEVLAEHKIPFDLGLVAPGSFDRESGSTAVQLLLDERKASFTAMVCGNDATAIGAIDELKSRRIAVPEDVAVIGFDDTDMSRYVDPPLTTVRQPLRVQSRIAVETVLSELAGLSPPRQSVLQTQAVVRESCGCPAYLPHGSPGAARDSADESAPADPHQIAESMRALNIPGAPETDWPEELYAAFMADATGVGTTFLRDLDQLVRTVARANGDVGLFQKTITLLGESAAERFARGTVPARESRRLLHAGRAMISGLAERVPAQRMLRVELLSNALLATNRALATAVDIRSLREVLAQNLSAFAIPGCFICRHEGEGGPAEYSRLIAAIAGGQNVDLPDEGVRFPTEELLPGGFLDGHEPRTLIVYPLEYGEGDTGYLVFEQGPPDGFVYVALLDQIGAAFRKMRLLERLVQEANALEAAKAERLEREMNLARDIQMGVLPRNLRSAGLEIAASSRPATEVGGDYYDVIPSHDGCWLGIGDVAGHGLPTGLVMLMLHSAVSALTRRRPGAPPSSVMQTVNSVLYENIRRRMDQDEHVTLTLLRYHQSGRIVYAGAHEDMLVCRAGSGDIEWIPTTGTWVGAVDDIRAVTVDHSFELNEGDLLVLYTDGVTEARNDQGETFGLDRLAAEVQRMRHAPADAIRTAVLAAIDEWMDHQEDDLTILVARQQRW